MEIPTNRLPPLFLESLTGVQFAKLQVQVEKLIKPDEDSVRIYVLDAGAVKRTIAYGSEKPRQVSAIVL